MEYWNDGMLIHCGTPLGFDGVDDRQPSVRYATLGFGVQRRWRIKNKIGASGAH